MRVPKKTSSRTPNPATVSVMISDDRVWEMESTLYPTTSRAGPVTGPIEVYGSVTTPSDVPTMRTSTPRTVVVIASLTSASELGSIVPSATLLIWVPDGSTPGGKKYQNSVGEPRPPCCVSPT